MQAAACAPEKGSQGSWADLFWHSAADWWPGLSGSPGGHLAGTAATTCRRRREPQGLAFGAAGEDWQGRQLSSPGITASTHRDRLCDAVAL